MLTHKYAQGTCNAWTYGLNSTDNLYLDKADLMCFKLVMFPMEFLFMHDFLCLSRL